MPTDTPPTKKTVRRGRRRLWGVLAIGLALGTGSSVATYHYYTTPERVRLLCESYLQQFTEGRVTVEAATFSWREGVRLTDVVVHDVPRATDDSTSFLNSTPAFSCRHVAIRLNPLSLITGGRRVESIIAESPTFAIVRDLADGSTNLSRLFRPMLEDPVRGMPAGAAPIVELREARVKVLSRSKEGDRVVDDLTVTIKARSRKLEPNIYDMVWESVGRGPRAGGITAEITAAHAASDGHSQIDLRTGHLRNVRGGLPWMSIEAVMLAINARYDAVGAWNDLLGLDGTVRAVDYNLTRDPQGDGAPSATIALNGASISVPINPAERDVPPHERYLRLEDVDGRITLTGEAIHVELDGLFHASPCHVSATIRAGDERPMTLADVAFEADISVQSLMFPRTDPETAPDEARFIAAFEGLARFYRTYQVRGRADLACRLTKRSGADHPIEVEHALVTLRGAGLTWRPFPYPADEVEGVVEYTPAEGLFLRGLHGRHGQTEIALEGWVEELKAWSKKRVAVTAKHVVVDDALRRALPERYRRIEARFQPEGSIDVEVLVTQEPGTMELPTRPQTRAEVALRGVSARYDDFPYPIDDLTGTLVFESSGAQLRALSGRAGAGRVQIDGQITTSDQVLDGLNLAITAQKVLFDDRLFEALSPEMRTLIDSFEPEGPFNLNAKLTLDPVSGRIVRDLSVMLDGASIRHEGLPIRLRDVIGEVRVSATEVLVNGLTGKYLGATVSVDGRLAAAGAAQSATLLVRANKLQLDDTIRRALPTAWREQLAAWSIDGPVSTETVFRTDPTPTGTRTFAPTSVRLDGVTVHHDDFPIPFHEVRGEIQFDARGIHGSGLTGRYGQAEVTVDLDVRREAGKEDGTISLTAKSLPLDDSLRDLLSKRLRTTWDELTPEGTIDLHLERLSFHRPGADAPREWTVDGYAELTDVAVPHLLAIEHVTGTLVGGGLVLDRLAGTTLSGEFTLKTADILGRRVLDTRSEWSFTRAASGEGVFSLPSLSGLLYGGSVKGAVDLGFDREETEYNISATLHSVDIDKCLNANRTGERIDVRGLLDGRLHLSGTVGDTSSRRGGGQFEIFDGHIYRVPVILAILNVLDLSLTAEDVFGSARADFLISGDRAYLNDLWIRGAAFALVGGGSMSLPDQAVDLGLVRVNPNVAASSWSEFVKGAQREIVELRVTGPLSAPTVGLRPFPGIADELKELFKPRKKPGRIRPSSP